MAGDGFEDFMSDADALMWAIEQDPLLRSTIVTAMFLDRCAVVGGVCGPGSSGACASSPGCASASWSRRSASAPRAGPTTPTSTSTTTPVVSATPTRRATSSSTTSPPPRRWSAFDRDRPLWEYTLVEDLPGGRAAFVMKVHHSMTDGVGGIKLLLMLLDLERDPAAGRPRSRAAAPPRLHAEGGRPAPDRRAGATVAQTRSAVPPPPHSDLAADAAPQRARQ